MNNYPLNTANESRNTVGTSGRELVREYFMNAYVIALLKEMGAQAERVRTVPAAAIRRCQLTEGSVT